jgi:hypothetical protein
MGDFLYISIMKDLTKYVESLLDGIKNPCEVKYVDNIYHVDIVYDYGNSVNLYRFGDFLIKSLVTRTETMLATYLPETMFKVRVNRINIPIEYQTINVSFTVSTEIDLGEISSYVVDHYPMNFLDNNDPL